MKNPQAVMRLDDLWEGDLQSCEVSGRRLLLARIDGQVYAYDDRCPHLGAALSAGTLEDGVLTCSMHHWQFDLRSGRGVNPASAKLCPHPVMLHAGQICVDGDVLRTEPARESG